MAALEDFKRFPTWMWRNTDVLRFVEWLRAHDQKLSTDAERIGFYGMDLYSLHASMQAVLRYLARIDPAAAARARLPVFLLRSFCRGHTGVITRLR